MTRTSASIAAIAAVTLMALAVLSPPAHAADVFGVVTEASGTPVQGVKVIAENRSGQALQSAVSGKQGSFKMSGLRPGAYYRFALDTGKSGFKSGAPVEAFVSAKGLILKWIVSPTAAPIALAKEATSDQVAADDPFGLTWTQLALIGGTIVIGGTASGVAAAEATSGNQPIASSSK